MAFPDLIIGFMRLQDYPELGTARALARWINEQLEQGLDTFDHADIYGGGQCERAFGNALRLEPQLQQRVRLITKADIVPGGASWVKHYRAEPSYLSSAIDAALLHLNVEQIDTFLIHRPDPLMDAPGVARILEKAVRDGKIKHIGVSNFLPEQWRWLQANTTLPLSCNQSELSLIATAPLFNGHIEANLRDNLKWLAWSPLAGGGLDKPELQAALAKIGERTGLSTTALAVAWLRSIPGKPIPVLGSLRPGRIAEALKGAQTELSREDWFAALEAARGEQVA